jgi:tRNA threonylcarbamoyladenosine biosynthesis protein TsaB
MNVLALDAATPSSAVALARADGWQREARDEVAAGERPRHAQQLLALAAELLGAAGMGWDEIEQVAVGVGPGGYTGLRIAVACARGIALAHGAQLVGVGTLRALAEPLRGETAVAVLDARRGEAFIALYRDGEELLAPRVARPPELAALARRGGGDPLAIGDGALRFREFLEGGGVRVAPAASHLHRVSAGAICRLASGGKVTAPVPDYLRLADAELALSAETR